MGRKYVPFLGSLLIILSFQSDLQATTCATSTLERTTEIAQQSIYEGFWHGVLFGLCIGISTATLFVLFRYRRFVLGAFYLLLTPLVLLTIYFFEIFNRGCLSSGFDLNYYGLILPALATVLAISIVFRNWQYGKATIDSISIREE